jgi:hypothetical protein
MSEYLRPIDLNGAGAGSSITAPPASSSKQLNGGPPSSAVPENPKNHPDPNQNSHYGPDLLPSATTTKKTNTSTTTATATATSLSQRMKWSIPGRTSTSTTSSTNKDLRVPDRYAVIQKSFSNPPALTNKNHNSSSHNRSSSSNNNMLQAQNNEDDDDNEKSQYYGKPVDDFLDLKTNKQKQQRQQQVSEKESRASSAPEAIMRNDDNIAELPSLLSNKNNITQKSTTSQRANGSAPAESSYVVAGGIDMQSLGITGKVMTPEVRRYYDLQQGRVTGILATPQVVANHDTRTSSSSNHMTRTVKTRNTAPTFSNTNPATNSSTSLIDSIGDESPAAAGFDFTNSFTDGMMEQPRQTTTSSSSLNTATMSSTLPQKLRGLFLTKTANPTNTSGNMTSYNKKNIILDSHYNVQDVTVDDDDDDESVTQRTSNADSAFRRVPSSIPASTKKPKKNVPELETATAKVIGFQNEASPTGTTAELRQILKQCVQENFSNVETLDETFQNELVQAFTMAIQEVKRSRSRAQLPEPASTELSHNSSSSLIVSAVVLVLTLVRVWYLYCHYSPPVIPETQTPVYPVQAWISSMSKALLAAKQKNFESDLDFRLVVIQFEAGV